MIKLIKSTFFKEEQTKKALIKFIKSAKKLSFGPQCEKFERNFAKYQGRKYCVFFNSGSSANLAIVQSLLNLGKIKKGDSVGFSSLTWSTSVMPLIELGLNAVPIDVELDTLNASSEKLNNITKKYPIKMLFLTNLLGFCDDIERIKQLCANRKILLLEDNCESLGTIYKNKKLGNFGLASTFSFYVGHHMSIIEGGAVCTDEGQIATMLKIVRAHGWDRNLNLVKQRELRKKFKVNSTFYSKYTFYDLGYNLRPTEISGFLGNIQLQYIDEIIKRRNANFLEFAEHIYKQKSKYFPIRFDHIDLVSNFAIPVICRSQKIRNKLIDKCKRLIEIRPIVAGDITRQHFFRKYYPTLTNDSTNHNAKIIHDQGLYFGNHPELTPREIEKIIDVFVKE